MRYVIAFCFCIFLISCEADDATPTIPVNDDFDPSTATLLKSGTFVGTGHSVSGTASIYDSAGMNYAVLDPFMSQNGPDLKVYFSKDENASSYISLGDLKSVSGKQSYLIPGNPNLEEYNYVLIWCEQFTVLFGKAKLE